VRALDLTDAEQGHVRTALHFLRARCNGWRPLAKVLGTKHLTVARIARGRPVTPTMAFRIARLANVGVDDVLAGRFPPAGACPHCGHCAAQEAMT
jgi:plasmid maintenance system antidote protein VapI